MVKKCELTRVPSSVATRINLPLGENLANDTAGTLSSISVLSKAPVAVSQILQDPSWLPETIKEPSLLKCTDVTGIAWARITCSTLPVLTSQTLIVSSKAPETIKLDCGLKLTQKTLSVWPLSVLTQSAARTSQMRRVRSSEAEQMYVESEDQERSLTPSEWPIKREIWVRVAVEYTIRVLSREEEANKAPLLENLTQDTARVWLVRIFWRRYGWCSGAGVALAMPIVQLPLLPSQFPILK